VNFPFFVAKRYYFSRQSRSVINLITWIAVIGLAVSTAAMSIVLSAFNGIESLVHDLYSDFDPEITIESKKGKTFNYNFISHQDLHQIDGVQSVSPVIEEIVIIKHENKWVNGLIYGLDSTFLEAIKIQKHILDGSFEGQLSGNKAIIGAGLLNKLNGAIFTENLEQIIVYAPSRNAKIMRSANPFTSANFQLLASCNYNREVNAQSLLIDVKKAAELLNYGDDVTRIAIAIQQNKNIERIKNDIQQLVGTDFLVKTHLEKNELIYKTSKIEKLIVFFILIFIFILATFNMVASLTMLFIDKKPTLKTLMAIGLTEKGVFSIFFYQGLLITFSGVLIGLIIGYAAIATQYFGEFLILPNGGGDAFPVRASLTDFFLIMLVTLIVGYISSWLSVRFLVKRFMREKTSV
jgi:lipoprotein-releasing system permease protein